MRHHHISEYLNILPEHTDSSLSVTTIPCEHIDSSLSVTTLHVSTLIHHCDIITIALADDFRPIQPENDSLV